MERIVIVSVNITPNPVYTGEKIKITVKAEQPGKTYSYEYPYTYGEENDGTI